MKGPNEKRTISREHLGFYNSVAVGGIYEFSSPDFDVTSRRSFFGAAKKCIDEHPTLSYVVRDSYTDAAFFERVASVNLEEHISIVGDDKASQEKEGNDLARINAAMPSIVDHQWSMATPPWKLFVLPLSAKQDPGDRRARCFVVFAFSHALGDAMTAIAFHRTFKAGLFDQLKGNAASITMPDADFPSPFDTPKTLPISWSFLLRPLIAVLLPKFLAEMLGLRSTASTIKPDTWTASKMFYEPDGFQSCLKLVELPGPQIEALLQLGRKKGAKLTAMIHQSLVRGLSREIPRSKATNFVSGTAVNMRRAVGRSNDDMGLFVNAWYESHDRIDEWAKPWSEQTWENARALTKKLAVCAVTLEDQAVGLLRYVPSIKKWTAAKIGQPRESSYEISNLGCFEIGDREQAEKSGCRVTKLVFSHSANVTSSPFTLSIVSLKGGSMVISISWQPGALGIPLESEQALIDRLAAFIEEDLRSLE